MIKKSILLVSILSLVGCSQNYVKMTHDAIIIDAKQDSHTRMVLMPTGKLMRSVPTTSYSCDYKVEIYGTSVVLSTSAKCKYSVGDIAKVQEIHRQDTNEFVKYQLLN